MHFKHLAIGAVVSAALLVAAPAGFAQTAAESGYSTPAGSVQQQLDPGDPRANVRAASDDSTGADSGTLPFTGFDLGLIGLAGGVLLAFGLAVRRVVSSATP